MPEFGILRPIQTFIRSNRSKRIQCGQLMYIWIRTMYVYIFESFKKTRSKERMKNNIYRINEKNIFRNWLDFVFELRLYVLWNFWILCYSHLTLDRLAISKWKRTHDNLPLCDGYLFQWSCGPCGFDTVHHVQLLSVFGSSPVCILFKTVKWKTFDVFPRGIYTLWFCCISFSLSLSPISFLYLYK